MTASITANITISTNPTRRKRPDHGSPRPGRRHWLLLLLAQAAGYLHTHGTPPAPPPPPEPPRVEWHATVDQSSHVELHAVERR